MNCGVKIGAREMLPYCGMLDWGQAFHVVGSVRSKELVDSRMESISERVVVQSVGVRMSRMTTTPWWEKKVDMAIVSAAVNERV